MSGQNFHHSLKEHHKISNIPKFRCGEIFGAFGFAVKNAK
jgi:hypothetical protein